MWVFKDCSSSWNMLHMTCGLLYSMRFLHVTKRLSITLKQAWTTVWLSFPTSKQAEKELWMLVGRADLICRKCALDFCASPSWAEPLGWNITMTDTCLCTQTTTGWISQKSVKNMPRSYFTPKSTESNMKWKKVIFFLNINMF